MSPFVPATAPTSSSISFWGTLYFFRTVTRSPAMALNWASDATSDLVTQLRDLGPPDLESGDDLEEQLDESTAELESSFDALKESAEAAADAPAGESLQQLAGLASDFAALQTAISNTVTTLQNADVADESKAELEQAFGDAPSCQSLGSES